MSSGGMDFSLTLLPPLTSDSFWHLHWAHLSHLVLPPASSPPGGDELPKPCPPPRHCRLALLTGQVHPRHQPQLSWPHKMSRAASLGTSTRTLPYPGFRSELGRGKFHSSYSFVVKLPSA